MIGESVAPDFDLGLFDNDTQPSPEHSSDNAASDNQSEADANTQTENTEVNTEQRLKRLLEVEEARTGADTTSPPRRLKRQRESRSRSVPPRSQSRQERSPKKVTYICPTKIADIFDRKISSKDLCALSAITHGSPTTVRKIIPGATVDQICKLVKL